LEIGVEPVVLRVKNGFEFGASLIDVAVNADFCQFTLPHIYKLIECAPIRAKQIHPSTVEGAASVRNVSPTFMRGRGLIFNDIRRSHSPFVMPA
jgi:hypothetical protein